MIFSSVLRVVVAVDHPVERSTFGLQLAPINGSL